MAHANEDVIRRGYEAFGKGDMDTLNELFTDDIAWHTPGRSPIAGDLKGKQEVFAFFAKLVELSGGTFKLEVHDILANDEHGVALSVATGQRNGKSFEDRAVNVFHLRDGKVTEFWAHPGDQYVVDDFWS